MIYDFNLSLLELFQSLGGVSLLTLGIIYIIRWKFRLLSKNNLKVNSSINKVENTARSRTKYPEVDAFKYSKILLKYGLFVALVCSISVISWTSIERVDSVLIEPDVIEDIEAVPLRTYFQKPIPPLPPIIGVVIDVPEEVEFTPELLEEEIRDVTENTSVDSLMAVDSFNTSSTVLAPKMELPEDIDLPPEFIHIAEDMPRFPGCEDEILKKDKEACAQKKMLDFIYSQLKYPSIARDNRVEGVCVVSFVVSKNGTISDIELLRDIGAGCGKNALRTIKKMSLLEDKWIPGKQRGHTVNVRYTLPIKFKLEK